MTKLKDYIQLHLNILLFSLTSVFPSCCPFIIIKRGLIAVSLFISFSYDRKLWNLRHRVAAGNQKIFPFHGLRQQECLSSVVTGMGL